MGIVAVLFHCAVCITGVGKSTAKLALRAINCIINVFHIYILKTAYYIISFYLLLYNLDRLFVKNYTLKNRKLISFWIASAEKIIKTKKITTPASLFLDLQNFYLALQFY